MTQLTKKKILEYLESSAITFIAFFCLAVYPDLKNLDFANLEMAGSFGAFTVIVRLCAKAAWEAFIIVFGMFVGWLKTRFTR